MHEPVIENASMQEPDLGVFAYLNYLPEIAWIFDSKHERIYVNSIWHIKLGIEKTSVWQSIQTWSDTIHPNDVASSVAAWEVCLKQNQNFEYRFRLRIADGTYNWFLARCCPAFDGMWTGICTDINENVLELEKYRSLSEDLSTRRELILTVLDYLPVAVIVADKKGQILFANNRMEEIWGYKVKLSKTTTEYAEWVGFHPDGTRYNGDEWPLARSILYGEVIVEELVDILRGDGRRTILSLSSSPIYDKGTTEQIGAVVICQDVNEKIALQKAKLEALNQAKTAMETARFKSNFIANMSHDIRTPINGIIGLTNLLLLTEMSADQYENVVTIADCGKTLINLINDILDISKIEAGKMQLENIEFSLLAILDSVRKVSRASLLALDKKVEIKTTPINLPPFVRGDPRRLEQILSNLVQNSIKFTPDGGKVEISIEILDREEPDTVHCIIKVADSGIGIEKSVQKSLFRPFTQADSSTTRKYGGSGLGLSICKNLTELMKGTIELESELGQGTTFTLNIDFGRVGDAYHTTTNEDCVKDILTKEERSRCKILVAEDNKISAVVAQRLLSVNGYTDSTWVHDGSQAYEAFLKNSYDLILMDCQMPVMDGFEATRRIRMVNKRIPIFALTASATQDDRNACLESGMNVVILKPFDPDIMVSKIDEYLSSRMFNGKATVDEVSGKGG